MFDNGSLQEASAVHEGGQTYAPCSFLAQPARIGDRLIGAFHSNSSNRVAVESMRSLSGCRLWQIVIRRFGIVIFVSVR